MKIKHAMTVASVQLVIMDAIQRSASGATWKEIKQAINDEGWEPHNWLTQVRGPLQGLMNEGRVRRVDSDYESERYVAQQKNN